MRFRRPSPSLIHERTEGNPLFMADVLRDLRRRQIIQQPDGRWIITENVSAIARELPESVRSLIQRKMDALEDTDRRLLSAASVQGMDFDSALLAAVVQIDEEEVESRLERLEREHALVRFVARARSPGPVAHAAVSIRAPHVPERVLRCAAGDAQGRR